MINIEDFITESILSLDKVPTLVHELLVIEIWKTKIASLLKEELIKAHGCSLTPYLLVSKINICALQYLELSRSNTGQFI